MIELNISRKIFNDIYFPYLFDYSHRYEIYYGGAGSGKSIFVFQKVLLKALKSQRRVLVVRKVARTHADSTFRVLLDILSQWRLLGKCTVNKSTMRITTANGSEFLFVGMDDPEKVKSIAGITDIVCEEATELTLEDVSQLDLRLRAQVPNLQTFYMFNPTSKANWVYGRWFAPAAIPNDDTFILKTTYRDNKFLPPEYISALEEKINSNPVYYRIYALGEFCSLDKLVYTNYEVREFDPTEIKGQLLCGLDWGYTNDPTAFICSLLDEKNKTIYVFKEWYETGQTNPQIVKAITALGFAKSVIVCDSAEPKSIAEVKNLGLIRAKSSLKGPDSIRTGIQKLQQYKIVIHPTCGNFLTEIENYAWQKDKQTGEYIEKPIDQFNHLLDALRYSLQSASLGKLGTVDMRGSGL